MKPVDYVVFAIVVLVGVIISSPILAFIMSGERPDVDARELLVSLVASLIAIVSIYVGAKLNHKDDE